MICWSFRWSRQRQDHAVRSVSALPHAAIATILAWWQTCPAQVSVYNLSCMCVGSFVTLLTASERSLRNDFPPSCCRGHGSPSVCARPFNRLAWRPVESWEPDLRSASLFKHRQQRSFAVSWSFQQQPKNRYQSLGEMISLSVVGEN